ncbi:MAG: AMP-binding protein, partial [Kangiellaceae bacterium]
DKTLSQTPVSISDSEVATIMENVSQLTDLTVVIEQHANKDNFLVSLIYRSDCFELSTLSQFLSQLEFMAENNSSDTSLEKMALINSVQCQELALIGQGKKKDLPFFTIGDKLEHFAAQSKNDVALKHNHSNLSYGQLNEQVNQLAHFLIEQGIVANSRVATLLLPSFEVMIALLAIHKVGATYVPLDPEFPKLKISALIEQVQPQIIISNSGLTELLEGDEATEQVSHIDKSFLFDKDKARLLNHSKDNPNVSISEKSIATIFFTSGTTGVPKGVMASYANVSHYLAVANRRYGYQQTDVIPAVARFTFSISIFELLSPIFAGGTLVLLDREMVLDLNKMSKLLTQVTAIHIGPSLLGALVTHIKKSSDEGSQNNGFTNLRHISSGGDMVPAVLLRDMQTLFNHSEIYVIYGCSEISCMGVTHYYEPQQSIEKTHVGSAFENMTVSLRDDNLNPVPLGAVGNIYFSGNGLTLGYLDQTSLTDEKFIIIDGERCYNTGDRGRYNEKGELEFLGRKDFQIQLHGIRVELGEIESLLKQQSVVKDGVVAQKELPAGKKLIAYVVKNETDNFPASHLNGENQLKESLAKVLPDYMVPDHICFLPKLPLNHNFKIDRKALPTPKADLYSPNSDTAVELSETEKVIYEIWCSVLKIENLNVQANFFQLGGDSLSLALCVAQTHSKWQHNVLLSLLFKDPSVSSWAKIFEDYFRSPQTRSLPKIVRLSGAENKSSVKNTIRTTSYQQQQFWYLYRLKPKSTANNIPFAYRVSKGFQFDAFVNALEILIQRYEIFRTQLNDGNDGLELIVKPFDKNLIDRNQVNLFISENEVTQKLKEATEEAFDLESGELFKIKFFGLESGQFVIFMAFHHIAIDQRSITQFGEELNSIYSALLINQKVESSPTRFQYADYASWQNKILTKDYVRQQQDFWKNQLDGVAATLDFPLDNPRSESDLGEEILFDLSDELVETLEDYSKNNSITVYTLLLATFSTLLFRHTGKSNIVLGTPFVNRDQLPELQNIMGCFINMLPVVSRFENCHTFEDLLSQLQENLNSIRDHQNISLQDILEVTDIKRSVNCNPIYQVGLSYQEAPLELKLEGVDIEPIELKTHSSQLDFTFKFWRHSKGISASLIYNQSIFYPETMQGLVDRFHSLISKLLINSKADLRSIDYLSDAEKNQMSLWNQTNVEICKQETLLDAFDLQCDKTPDNIALLFEGQAISYKEMAERSNSLANYLVSQGVLQGDYVGLHFLRSIELIIAVYAVVRIGGAYVPIDPDYPETRKTFII